MLGKFVIKANCGCLLGKVGLGAAERFFTNPLIKPWRIIAERENCILDVPHESGTKRFHVKRFKPQNAEITPAELEANGIALLEKEGIPTASLAAWGVLEDGRSFVVVEDLAGYISAGKLLAGGVDFRALLPGLASIAARLHRFLHHQDLYLCHIFVHPETLEMRIIDAGRVRRLPRGLLRYRWLIKDMAQLCYSVSMAGIADAQVRELLECYLRQSPLRFPGLFRRGVKFKAGRIRRHARRLDQTNPERNVSIPA